jgi:hypothetical protein
VHAVSTVEDAASMPKRTNRFQRIVAIVHSHMSEGATVVEPVMVDAIRGGAKREVDVLITSVIAGHPIRIGVEDIRDSLGATSSGHLLARPVVTCRDMTSMLSAVSAPATTTHHIDNNCHAITRLDPSETFSC